MVKVLEGFSLLAFLLFVVEPGAEELTGADSLFPLVQVDKRGADEASASVKS